MPAYPQKVFHCVLSTKKKKKKPTETEYLLKKTLLTRIIYLIFVSLYYHNFFVPLIDIFRGVLGKSK